MSTFTPTNDTSCGWVQTLPERQAMRRLTDVRRCEWAVLGAGFTGLAAARRLARHFPEATIVLLDAQRAAEGASGRNAGFIVDSSLFTGGQRAEDDENYLRGYRLNLAGMSTLRNLVEQHNIDCDWQEDGKYHAAADARNYQTLKDFSALLNRYSIAHTLVNQSALIERFGIDYYGLAVHTEGGVLVQPAALGRGLITALPNSVELIEESPIERIVPGRPVKLIGKSGTLLADKVILATNAFLPSLGYYRDGIVPLTLTASLTRPLTDNEMGELGHPAPWGVVSAHRTGATVRLTADRRLFIRNTAEYWPAITMTEADLAKRRQIHLKGLRARFPMFPDLEFEHTWSGVVAVTRNSGNVFSRLTDNLFVAGCYNAGGIAKGTLFGTLIADYAVGRTSDLLTDVLNLAPPAWIPPRPFVGLGAKTNLAWRRRSAGKES